MMSPSAINRLFVRGDRGGDLIRLARDAMGESTTILKSGWSESSEPTTLSGRRIVTLCMKLHESEKRQRPCE